MTNNEGMHAKSKSKVRRRYPALQLMRIEPECLKMSTPFGRRRRTGNILDRFSAAVAPAMRLRNAASRGAALERGLPLLQDGGRVLIDAARFH